MICSFGGRNLRAQPPGGRDRLQAGNANPHHECLGRRDRPRRGHHHREGPAVKVCRLDHCLVPGQIRLAGQDIHRLSAGNPRHEFHRQRLESRLGISVDPRALNERIKAGNDPGPGIRAFQCCHLWPLHPQHDVRTLGRVLAQFRARCGIVRVGNRCPRARARLDRHARAQSNEFLDRFRARRDTGFPARGFLEDRDAHAFATLSAQAIR
jgi:hypothetical protein